MVERLVQDLLAQFQHSLPNLNHIAVFFPNPETGNWFRKKLLENLPPAHNQAVIPPWCGLLQDWVNEFIPLPSDSIIINEQARRLMFIEALQAYPKLYNEENKWQVTLELLKLFDEINVCKVDIAHSQTDWINTIQKAYGMSQLHQHLQQEATLVHTLWLAWHEQMHANKLLDNTSAYLARLGLVTTSMPENIYFYAANSCDFFPCEQALLQTLTQQKLCTDFVFSKTDSGDNQVNSFIQHAFSYQSAPFKNRAEKFQEQTTLSAAPFSVYAADNTESEARAVDLQIRRWLLSGVHNIAVICEDRKLSRRVRALLERADVPLLDLCGWSLATTSAAAALERWIECIEEDFDCRPMLDFLKSRFFSHSQNGEHHLNNVYRLEHDIILHENIARGLNRYKQHLKYRLKKLEHWPADSYDGILQLLDLLQTNAKTLRKLYASKHPAKASQFLDALLHSIRDLGLEQSFLQDAAGVKIMQSLSDMQRGLKHADPKLNWSDFRIWLGATLEEQLFKPQTASTSVQLMTLDQADLKRFDAIIIAATDSQHIPGNADTSPFFNQGVRKSLGLPIWESQRENRLSRFKRLLQAAPEVLITYKTEDNGEPVILSPWVETLKNFSRQVFNQPLDNTQLTNMMLEKPAVFICDSSDMPYAPEQPAPNAVSGLTPPRISASAHQRLINCPYQYFTGDMLGLKPSDEIREELQKSDYGELVHKILRAFHQAVENLPSPFTDNLSEKNRDKAIEHLVNLSSVVFKRDIENNVLHRSWLHRWLAHVPAYIDWQITQQQNWGILETEQNHETILNNKLKLYGRLDRIDSNSFGHAIIDYKTGRTPGQENIDTGEDVQLASYALLDETASLIEYLSLDEKNGGVKISASISGEQLQQLRTDTKNRLSTLNEMINNGHTMPAWGDETVCGYCDFSGLCRRKVWKE